MRIIRSTIDHENQAENILIIVSIISKKGKQKLIMCSNNLPENNKSTFNNLYLSNFYIRYKGTKPII